MEKDEKWSTPMKGKHYKNMHSHECKVCNSPQKDEINQDFINWHPVKDLSEKYGISETSLRQHIHYFKLRDKRAKNYMKLIDSMIEMGQLGMVPDKFRPNDLKELITLKAKLEGEYKDSHRIEISGELGKLTADQLREALSKLGIILPGEEEK